MAEPPHISKEDQELSSCEPSITRQEFIEQIVKRAALIGTIMAAPKLIDRFLVPPAYAAMSTLCSLDTVASDLTSGGTDTLAGRNCRP